MTGMKNDLCHYRYKYLQREKKCCKKPKNVFDVVVSSLIERGMREQSFRHFDPFCWNLSSFPSPFLARISRESRFPWSSVTLFCESSSAFDRHGINGDSAMLLPFFSGSSFGSLGFPEFVRCVVWFVFLLSMIWIWFSWCLRWNSWGEECVVDGAGNRLSYGECGVLA